MDVCPIIIICTYVFLCIERLCHEGINTMQHIREICVESIIEEILS